MTYVGKNNIWVRLCHQSQLKSQQGGRIVIPAEIRRKMDIHCGDQVILSYHDGELHIATRKQRLQQAKAIVKAYAGDMSLAEQLAAERRAEAND